MTTPVTVPVRLTVDGTSYDVEVDTRTTVLDLLREGLDITSPKKGCDHGQCGACTVLVDGRRAVACLLLAVQLDGAEVVTADGLGEGDDLHPMADAFVRNDGMQCGYCTPGQVCSAIGMLDEHKAGHPSHAHDDVNVEHELDDAEIRERMSGNLCRCGAQDRILAAIREAAG